MVAFNDLQTALVGIRHLYTSLLVGLNIRTAGNYPWQWTLLRWYAHSSAVVSFSSLTDKRIANYIWLHFLVTSTFHAPTATKLHNPASPPISVPSKPDSPHSPLPHRLLNHPPTPLPLRAPTLPSPPLTSPSLLPFPSPSVPPFPFPPLILLPPHQNPTPPPPLPPHRMTSPIPPSLIPTPIPIPIPVQRNMNLPPDTAHRRERHPRRSRKRNRNRSLSSLLSGVGLRLWMGGRNLGEVLGEVLEGIL